MAWIEQFPQTPGLLIRVPSPSPEVDSLHSYRFAAKERDVPVLSPIQDRPNLNWFAVAAVRAEGRVIVNGASSSSDLMLDEDLMRCSFWLTRFMSSDGNVTIPDVEWQLRIASNCTSEVIEEGIIQLKDGDQVGLIVTASGWLCNQFELWCRIVGGAVTASLGIDVQVSRSDPGSAPSVYKGSVGV